MHLYSRCPGSCGAVEPMHDDSWITSITLYLTKIPHILPRSHILFGLMENKSHISCLVIGNQVQKEAARGLFRVQRLGLLPRNCLPCVEKKHILL